MLGGVRGALARFAAVDGAFLAAGLAFFAVVCLIPLVLLAVSILGFVLSDEQAVRTVVEQIGRNVPVYGRELTAGVTRIVETRRASGIAGVVTLVVFSMPLFRASRLVLHRMLGVKGGGRFLRNLVVDLGLMLVLGALLLAATVGFGLLHWLRASMAGWLALPARWFAWTGLGLSLGLSGTAFFVGYRYLPQRRVRVAPALGGAVVGAALWEVAKHLFALYVRRWALYDQVYGPVGVLVAFVSFVYYSALVYVLGAAMVAALEARRR